MTPLRILSIEDDPDLGGVLVDLLEGEDYAVELVPTGAEAEQRLAQAPYALVLADLMTGEGDPYEQLARIVRAASPTPVGVVTGWRGDAANRCVDYGSRFILTKPFEIEQLFEQLGRHTAVVPVSEKERRIISAYFSALGARRWDDLAALVTEDFIYNLPGNTARISERVEGREAFRAYAEAIFAHFPAAEFELRSVHALPAAVIASYLGSWARPGGGRDEQAGAVMFRFRGDRLSEVGIRVESTRLFASALTG